VGLRRRIMVARAFADDEEDLTDEDETTASQETDSEYRFDGLKVDFSEKIALLPPARPKAPEAA
jgi:ABC-type transport system involved in cytochrome bd biosynthesis fused ATPase/permease subunit